MELRTQVVGPLRYLNAANISSYSDVKLKSVEGDCFYTNRLVLSSASLMLHGIFQEIDLITSVTADDFILILTEYSSNHLRNVIDFITRGMVFLSGDSEASKGGLISNSQPLNDFAAFGIDLSTLLMLPVEDGYFEKFFNFEQASILTDVLYPVDLNDIKLEQLESMFQPELELSDEDRPLKRRAGRPRDSTKDKKKKKLVTKRKLKEKEKKSAKDIKLKVLKKSRKTRQSAASDDIEVKVASGTDKSMVAIEDLSEFEEENEKDSDPDFELNSGEEKTFKAEPDQKKEPRPKQYKNPSLDKIFKTQGERDSKKTLQCPHCVVGYNDPGAFKRHVMCHEVAVDFKLHFCLQCGKDTPFKTRHELQTHREEFHIGKSYTCDRCGQVFKGNYYHRFLQHIEEHNAPQKFFACVTCGFVAKSRKSLSSHIKGRGPYHTPQCAQCPVEFKTWTEHENHVDAVHGGKMLFKCGLCAQLFQTPQHEKIHRREIHLKTEVKTTRQVKKEVVCQFCGLLVAMTYYDNHLENKHGSGEHPCPHCDKIVKHPSVLQRHITSFHNPFPCEKCGQTMRNPHKYRLHLLSVHTPDHLKPYQCTICDPPKGFHKLFCLKEHQNVHNNSKPWKCDICGLGFNCRANKFAHVRGIHKGIKRKSKHARRLNNR